MKARELLVEFYEDRGMQDAASDLSVVKAYDEARRPKLTLSDLNRLRKSNDMEKVEKAERIDFIPTMYSPPTE
jgi:hypothetical protein